MCLTQIIDFNLQEGHRFRAVIDQNNNDFIGEVTVDNGEPDINHHQTALAAIEHILGYHYLTIHPPMSINNPVGDNFNIAHAQHEMFPNIPIVVDGEIVPF